MLLEVFSSRKVGSYVMKLVVGQALFVGSISLMYPSAFSIDSSRDLQIAGLILRHSGGLPLDVGPIIWYDFSPMAPLLYSASKLITGFSLIDSEVLVGFVFPVVLTLVVGAIAAQISKTTRGVLFAMWLSILNPFLWYFASLPIPEMLALDFLMLAALVLVKQSEAPVSRGIYPTIGLLVVAIVLTHGGIAIELLGALIVVSFLSRSRFALVTLAMSSVAFAAYLVYGAEVGVPSGLLTLASFVGSLAIHVSPALQPLSALNLTSVPIQIVLATTSTYWWVFLGVLGWFGLLRELNASPKIRTTYLTLSVMALMLVMFGALIDLLGSGQGQAVRYVSLFGYSLLCVPAAVGISSIRFGSNAKKVFAFGAVALVILATTASPLVSPLLWQQIGQTSQATTRLLPVTTEPELSSQTFLNVHDDCYVVVANYIPQFVDLSAGCPAVGAYTLPSESTLSTVGVASYSARVDPPFVVLLSIPKEMYLPYSVDWANPLSNLSSPSPQIVYSSEFSRVVFVGTK